jgi:glyoxylase-like metal-dependent hydrolase (beta-lactamase superfamily II)
VAEFSVLVEGYARDEGDDSRVGSTVSLVRDGDAIVVVDPGLVRSRSAILDPLSALDVRPEDVTDVVISHHHPDHTLNVALFPNARLHDHWAVYRDDLWISRDAEGYDVSPGVTLMETPGHTPQDISTVVQTADGVVVCTHLWWTAEGPAEDPYAPDPRLVHEHRARVLDLEPALIVPGHGPGFTVGDATPR